eukprot:TRINITY_DN12284_c0_g1_i1.p1 TRINITY_DN12284_c0_g1~~TRINITY_DN12284_c0_g1_i1.p1  ORF type:complete len:362 (-),score=63.43 TRINITY_DN12284_c0_g1_i1:236-1321(-)
MMSSTDSISITGFENTPVKTRRESQMYAEEVHLLGVNLSAFSHRTQFTICCTGVFVFYTTYGYFQEILFQHEDETYAWYYSTLQFFMSAALAWYEIVQVRKKYKNSNITPPLRAPLHIYLTMALVLNLARGLGNQSFQYLDYTTKVLFQSAKLIPVMIMGMIFFKRRYHLGQYLAVLMMIAGLILFSNADAAVHSQFSLVGVFFALAALICEAAKSNLQEKIMKDYHASQVEVAFFSNLIGFILCFPFLIVSGEIVPAVQFCNSHPHIYLYMFILFIIGYAASVCMLSLIRISDAFVSSSVSSARKVVTIILSFLIFHKPLLVRHILACAVFFVGMAVQIQSKRSSAPAYVSLKHQGDKFV